MHRVTSVAVETAKMVHTRRSDRADCKIQRTHPFFLALPRSGMLPVGYRIRGACAREEPTPRSPILRRCFPPRFRFSSQLRVYLFTRRATGPRGWRTRGRIYEGRVYGRSGKRACDVFARVRKSRGLREGPPSVLSVFPTTGANVNWPIVEPSGRVAAFSSRADPAVGPVGIDAPLETFWRPSRRNCASRRSRSDGSKFKFARLRGTRGDTPEGKSTIQRSCNRVGGREGERQGVTAVGLLRSGRDRGGTIVIASAADDESAPIYGGQEARTAGWLRKEVRWDTSSALTGLDRSNERSILCHSADHLRARCAYPWTLKGPRPSVRVLNPFAAAHRTIICGRRTARRRPWHSTYRPTVGRNVGADQ